MYNCWYEKFVNYSWGFPVYGYTLHPNQSLVWSEQNISPMWYVLRFACVVVKVNKKRFLKMKLNVESATAFKDAQG